MFEDTLAERGVNVKNGILIFGISTILLSYKT